MSMFRDLSDRSSIPLQRYFQLHIQNRAGACQLSKKDSLLHLRCLLAVASLDDPAQHHQKLQDELLWKCKQSSLPPEQRQLLLNVAKHTLETEDIVVTSGHQAGTLLPRLKQRSSRLAAVLQTSQNVFSHVQQAVDAAKAKQEADALLAKFFAKPHNASVPHRHVTNPVEREQMQQPATHHSSNPLLRGGARRGDLGTGADKGVEPATRKRAHEDTDGYAKAPRRGWQDTNFSRVDANGAPHQEPTTQAQKGVNDDTDMSPEEEAPPAKGGFVTAASMLSSDLRKKGQAFTGFSNNAGSHQAGPGNRVPVISRRPRGGAGTCGGGVRNGFVPPFLQKSIDGPGEKKESPYSEKVLNLLGIGSEDEVPEEIAKLEPKMVEMVCNEIVDSSGSVQWEDIAGQDAAKRLVQELVVWPILNPHLFKGARSPPRGLLLFGPPGTGKTLIGKAIASNMEATFFSISASSLTSKWIGEGEKMVRALFAVAGCLQPSVIFIDEIDSVLSARKSDGEHEASRRLKTEMLIQMEGCDPNSSSRRLLIIGATNRPEELDEAARRRLPKQLYIPLPCPAARRHMILRQLGPTGSVRASLSDADLDKLVSKTDGYSGSDMRNLIQEACQGPVREAVKLHGSALSALSEDDLRPVNLKDFQLAAKVQKASVAPAEVERYEQYNKVHGARYIDEENGANENDEDDDEW